MIARSVNNTGAACAHTVVTAADITFRAAAAATVCFHVALQRSDGAERFAADNADVRLLAGVGLSVRLQIVVERKRFAAYVTRVRSLAGVCAHVCGEVGGLGEGFAALATLIRLLTGVHAQVSCEVDLFTMRKGNIFSVREI